MARTFVFSDNLTARVEVSDPEGDSEYRAYCFGCRADLLTDSRERFHAEDSISAAERHADRCARCSDEACRNPERHDAGHRCRN